MPIPFRCTACGKSLNAPDQSAGKKVRCPQCKAVTQVPQQVLEAEEVKPAPVPEVQVSVVEDDENDDRRPCPACGEPIMNTARKCRFCGEILDEDLRRRKKKKKRTSRDPDDAPTAVEWVAVFLCPGLAFIGGVIYLLQGKSKAGLILGISFGMCVLYFLVRLVLKSVGN